MQALILNEEEGRVPSLGPKGLNPTFTISTSEKSLPLSASKFSHQLKKKDTGLNKL